MPNAFLKASTYPETELLPPCPDIQGQLKNSRYDRSDTGVGVLMDITSHGSFPPEGGAFRLRLRELNPHNYNTHQESENLLTSPKLLIHLLAVPQNRD
ncbi:hypothetical protein AVEN_154730-1 [Araneus ventricosus]|uniref:Uncharacterized protein n=1 Tax=Araneus ventricosus TaxID=182803 RepID=A0A4Y2K8B6_ARAVE|nr:hypothetical protein AVEN_154730-1 [Araneus ventricosus]